MNDYYLNEKKHGKQAKTQNKVNIMTYNEYNELTETQQLDITAAYLIDYSIVTEDEFALVTSINGHNLEAVESMLYARTGYRSYGQLLEEE